MRTNCNNWIIEALKGWIARGGIDIHQAPAGDVNKMARLPALPQNQHS